MGNGNNHHTTRGARAVGRQTKKLTWLLYPVGRLQGSEFVSPKRKIIRRLRTRQLVLGDMEMKGPDSIRILSGNNQATTAVPPAGSGPA
jgi:hypothetical protein